MEDFALESTAQLLLHLDASHLLLVTVPNVKDLYPTGEIVMMRRTGSRG